MHQNSDLKTRQKEEKKKQKRKIEKKNRKQKNQNKNKINNQKGKKEVPGVFTCFSKKGPALVSSSFAQENQAEDD